MPIYTHLVRPVSVTGSRGRKPPLQKIDPLAVLFYTACLHFTYLTEPRVAGFGTIKNVYFLFLSFSSLSLSLSLNLILLQRVLFPLRAQIVFVGIPKKIVT